MSGRLRTRLALPFVAIVLAGGVAVAAVAFVNAHRAVGSLSSVVRRQLDQDIHQKLKQFLTTAQAAVRLNGEAIADARLDRTSLAALSDHFWHQIRALESISSLYFGTRDGGLAVGGREAAGSELYKIQTESLSAGPFRKYRTDQDGRPTDTLFTLPHFDARTRPWYKAATVTDRLAWSDIYILSTGDGLAIAPCAPVVGEDGDFLGVASADLFLAHISKFLAAYRTDLNLPGVSFIVEQDGLLVASSSGTPLVRKTDEGRPRRLYAWESDDTVIQQIGFDLKTRMVAAAESPWSREEVAVPGGETIVIDGHLNHIDVVPYADDQGLEWIVVSVTPAEYFLAPVNRGLYQGVALILVSITLTAFAGVMIAAWLARPIEKLCVAASLVAGGNLGYRVNMRRQDEIGQLSCSFDQMAKQLEQAFRDQEGRIQEMSLLQKQAEAASVAKSRFLASMSHELRTPLSGLLGSLEIAASAHEQKERRDEYVLTAAKSAQRLYDLVTEILDFSKLSAHAADTSSRVPTDVSAVCQEVLELYQGMAAQRCVFLDNKTGSAGQFWIMSDRSKVRRVMMNLVSNAIKFTEEGSVTFGWNWEPAEGDMGTLVLTVEDTGIGIPPEHHTRIFEAFTQIDDGLRRVSRGGTGLGLPITRELVVALGGEIGVESRLGEGSRFSVRLPVQRLCDPIGASETRAAAPPQEGRARCLSVLVAEDDETNQKIILARLEKLGHRVTLARNGIEAIQAFADPDASFDLVLMDLHMPELDGVEATRAIWSITKPTPPIVALTASPAALDDLPERSLFLQVLGKPIKSAALAEFLNTIKPLREDQQVAG